MRSDSLKKRVMSLLENERKMNYLYAPATLTEKRRIYLELCDVIGDENRLELFDALHRMSARLRRFGNPEIVILLGVTSKDLPSIVSIKEIFLDTELIILIADGDQSSFDTAIRLKPKYIGMINGDLDKVVPVVKKLLQKSRRNEN